MKIMYFLAVTLLSHGIGLAQTNDATPVARQSEPDEIVAAVLAQNGHSVAYGESFIERQVRSIAPNIIESCRESIPECDAHSV